MAQVYKGFSTHASPAAHQVAGARLGARAAEATRRHFGRFFLALLDGVRNSEAHSSGCEESRHLPGSVFDPRYKGLTAQATYIDAGIRRRARMR
jgi:hypothetical protein